MPSFCCQYISDLGTKCYYEYPEAAGMCYVLGVPERETWPGAYHGCVQHGGQLLMKPTSTRTAVVHEVNSSCASLRNSIKPAVWQMNIFNMFNIDCNQIIIIIIVIIIIIQFLITMARWSGHSLTNLHVVCSNPTNICVCGSLFPHTFQLWLMPSPNQSLTHLLMLIN